MVTATTQSNAVARRVKEGQLRQIQVRIEREIERRADSDLTSDQPYLDLVREQRRLRDELDLLPE
jgi:hypothetical protein